MAIRELARLGAIACAILAAGAAHANGGFRIRHAEPIAATTADIRAERTASKATGAETFSFVAYGKQFDLELEPNARLLNGLDASQRQTLAKYAVFRGKVRGMPASWVRLVRSGSTLSGAFWDGSDLYSIAPGYTLSGHLEQPLAGAADQSVVYRLSDVVTDGVTATCPVRTQPDEGPQPAGALGEYSKLIAELQASAATLANRQIDVAFIGDYEFTAGQLPDPQAALLGRINIVDGMYAEQVGVMILASYTRLYQTEQGDPFNTSDAFALLDELALHRQNTTEVRNRGLAHLFTGRNLADNIAGVAFMNSLCDVEYGVGLAEGGHPETLSALIAAHEIGHNFNAPHDGEQNSPCVNTSQGHLMGPFVTANGSFSRCSLNQMYYAMESAACLVPANTPDARIDTEGLIAAAPGAPFFVPFEVASVGTADIANARVSFSLPSDFTLISANIAGGTCQYNAGIVSCEIGGISVGTARAGSVQLSTLNAGSRDIVMTVDAAGDHRRVNDSDTARIDIQTGADLSVGVSPARVDALSDESFSFVASVASVGMSDVSNATLSVSLGSLILEEALASGGTCTGTSTLVCTFGTLAPGTLRQVAVRARSAVARSGPVGIFASASNDGNAANNTRSLNLVVEAAADAMIEANLSSRAWAIGEQFDVYYTVSSIGPQRVDDVLARITVPTGYAVDSATGGGTPCTVNGRDVQCALGNLASRTSRFIVLRGRAVAESSGFTAIVSASNDDNAANNQHSLNISIRQGVDVDVRTSTTPSTLVERLPFDLELRVSNRGIYSGQDATVTATIPAGLEILEVAPVGSGSCSTASGPPTCTFATVHPNFTYAMRVRLRTDQPGTYPVAASVSAPADATPANNTTTANLVIREDIDVSLAEYPEMVGGIVNQPLVLPIKVRTGFRPLQNVTLSISSSGGIQFDSIEPLRSCTTTPNLVCSLGDLAGDTTLDVTLRLRLSSVGSFNSQVSVNVANDRDLSNNTRVVRLESDMPADLAMTIARPSLTASAGQAFLAEVQVGVLGVDHGRNVTVHARMPAGMTLFAVRQFNCSNLQGVVSCMVPTLNAGAPHTFGFDFVVASAGTYTVDFESIATNDPNGANNTGRITVVATDPPPPQPAPQSNGGGGGSGSLGWALIVLLFAPWVRRRLATR